MPFLTDRLSAWTLVPLRLIIGFGFAAHGYAKLSRGVDGFADILGGLGVPSPVPTAWVTALLELFGGIAIIAGAYLPFVAVPLVIIMLTAMFTVHLPFGFSTVKLMAVTPDGPKFGTPGYEMNLLYITGLVSLSIGGPSPLSFDRWRSRRNIE
jgi:putative oxidoreductase